MPTSSHRRNKKLRRGRGTETGGKEHAETLKVGDIAAVDLLVVGRGALKGVGGKGRWKRKGPTSYRAKK